MHRWPFGSDGILLNPTRAQSGKNQSDPLISLLLSQKRNDSPAQGTFRRSPVVPSISLSHDQALKVARQIGNFYPMPRYRFTYIRTYVHTRTLCNVFLNPRESEKKKKKKKEARRPGIPAQKVDPACEARGMLYIYPTAPNDLRTGRGD